MQNGIKTIKGGKQTGEKSLAKEKCFEYMKRESWDTELK